MKHTTTARAHAALVAIAGLAAATLTVSAQTPPNGPPPGPGMDRPGPRMPTSEAEFVRMLDVANTGELNTAKYVVNRTKDAAVHGFAQHMIDDHSTAAVALEAATRGTNLYPTPRDRETSGPGRRALAILEGDTGTQLDNDYMRLQEPAHRRALGLLQWETQNGQTTGLKDLATKLIPTVQQHLQITQNYLAAHNLTPFAPPETRPVPGNVNPGNSGAGNGPGTPNNPASSNNGGSTSGQGNGTALGATPAPAAPPSASPHP